MEEAITRREFESEKTTVWREIRRIREIVEGPPHPGLEKRVDAFMTTFAAVEKTRHEENQEQLQQLNQKLAVRSQWVAVAGIAIAFASLMVGILALYATVYIAKHADVAPIKLFSVRPDAVVSSFQTTQIPPVR